MSAGVTFTCDKGVLWIKAVRPNPKNPDDTQCVSHKTFENVMLCIKNNTALTSMLLENLTWRYNEQILESLNINTHFRKLDISNLASLREQGTWNSGREVRQFLETNTTINDLTISPNSESQDIFIGLLARNTVLTRLNIKETLYVPHIVADYISKNSTLKSIEISVGSNSNYLIMNALLLNTNLTSISINVSYWNDSQHILHTVTRTNLCKLVAETQTLKELRVNNHVASLIGAQYLGQSVIKNTSLHTICVHALHGGNFDKFIRAINANFTLTNIECQVEKGRYDKTLLKTYLERNRSLLWPAVHLALLDFVLIFYQYPAYVALEIFDWLPHMLRIVHYKKIQLIISIKKSIDRIKN